MKKIGLISLLASLFLSVYGQSKKQINICDSFWYELQHQQDNRLNLKHVIKSKDLIHFRYWLDGQAIDVWTKNNKTFKCLITNFIKKEKGYNYKRMIYKHGRMFIHKHKIDVNISKQVFEIISDVISIPTGDSIKGWESGVDGMTYIFEISTPTSYEFKTYWTPTAQDSTLKEAIKIQSIIDRIDSTLNLKCVYKNFFAKLKPGSYTSNDFIVRRKFSKQEVKYREKLKTLENKDSRTN